jgi:ubiquinone/menaquinone biosynthesis C-methylase UbiE
MTVTIKSFIPPIFFNLANYLKHRKFKNVNFRNELQKQISEMPKINELFPEKKIRSHLVYEYIRDTDENPDIFTTQLRFFWYYNYFKKNYPEIFEDETTILDVGGTSGIVIESLNKKGTVLNINEECVDLMVSRDIKAQLGNAECMDLADNSFDYVTSFQCLEHVQNPLLVLNEMGRVAKKKVFISIPYVERTKIYNQKYWEQLKIDSEQTKGEVKNVDCHIIEFSTEDLRNILSFTNLEYQENHLILYFDDSTPYRKYYNDTYGSYFNFFVLKPINK